MVAEYSPALFALENYAVLAEQVRNANTELAELRDLEAGMGAKPCGVRVAHSLNVDSMPDRMALIEERAEELHRDIAVWLASQRDVENLVSRLFDARQMEAIHRRYISGERVADIAAEMAYSQKTIYAFINAGIDELDLMIGGDAEMG